MALVPDERDQFPAKISCRVDWDILKEIKDNLSGRNKRKFQNSCFGHFWEMRKIQFQGQLCLQLLFRQDASESNDKIIFHINDKESEFGMREFAIITGLHFGRQAEAEADHSSLHEDIFGGRLDVKLIDVKDAFLTHAKEAKGRGDTVLKLALLYVLFGLLLAKERTSKRVDIQYIHLCDDLEAFDAFPWGRVAFQFLTGHIRGIMRERVRKYKEKIRAGKKHIEEFDLVGFTPALQVWAYEAIPEVARRCAIRVEGMEDRIPRMLRWTATSIPTIKLLKGYVFLSLRGRLDHDEVIVHPNLQPSVEEENEPFFQGLVEWQQAEEDLRRATKKRKRDAENEKSAIRHEERTKRMHDQKTEKMKKKKKDESDTDDLEILRKKIDRVEKMLIVVLKKLDCPLPSSSGDDENDGASEEIIGSEDSGDDMVGEDYVNSQDDIIGPLKDDYMAEAMEEKIENVEDDLQGDMKSDPMSSFREPHALEQGEEINEEVKGKEGEESEEEQIEKSSGGQKSDEETEEEKEEGENNADKEHEEEQIGGEKRDEGEKKDWEKSEDEEEKKKEGEKIEDEEEKKKEGEEQVEADNLLAIAVHAPTIDPIEVDPVATIMAEVLADLSARLKDEGDHDSETTNVTFVDIVTPDMGQAPLKKFTYNRRERKPARTIVSPFTDPSHYPTPKKQKTKDVTKQAMSSDDKMYDPCADYPQPIMTAAYEWLQTGREEKGKMVKVSIESIGSVPVTWFDTLITPEGWLSNEHIDSMISLAIYKRNHWPGSFLKRWTCTETFFWNSLNQNHWTKWLLAQKKKNPVWSWWDQDATLMEYITGRLPQNNGTVGWAHCDKVYGVAHVFQNHWVLYELDIEEQVVTVYDSLSKSMSPKRTASQFKKLVRMLPSMCDQAYVWQDRRYHGTPKVEWTFKRAEHPPQQTNFSDCGVMVIKYLECLATGRKLDIIDPGRCPEFRRRFVAELMHPDNILCTC